MECKSTIASKMLQYNKAELIDTLWNVNSVDIPHPATLSLELIDTLWNVNSSAPGGHSRQTVN